jgi:hypothetical protein
MNISAMAVLHCDTYFHAFNRLITFDHADYAVMTFFAIDEYVEKEQTKIFRKPEEKLLLAILGFAIMKYFRAI